MLVDKHFYLLDLTRGRYEYPRLARYRALRLPSGSNPNAILIEDASTGTALAQELIGKRGIIPVNPIPIDRDKIGRLYVQQAKFEAGLRAISQRKRGFLPELEAELCVSRRPRLMIGRQHQPGIEL